AGAYFLNYNSIKFSQAIDLCISQISGSRVHFGSVIKPLHVGLTAQKAWQIINFVGKGVSGNANTITGDNSLSSMYVENFTPTKEVFNNWGEEWAIDSPGLWFKSYPCCIANT